ncbi:MAG: hypothetical protein ABIP55_03790, partial [Tepidisphaeraceae bacterium]
IPGAIAAGLLEWVGVAIVLIGATAILAIWPLTPRWRCPSCGNRWSASEPEASGDEDDNAPEERDDLERDGTNDAAENQ